MQKTSIKQSLKSMSGGSALHLMKKQCFLRSIKFWKLSMKIFKMNTVDYFCSSFRLGQEKKKTLIWQDIYTAVENKIKEIELNWERPKAQKC